MILAPLWYDCHNTNPFINKGLRPRFFAEKQFRYAEFHRDFCEQRIRDPEDALGKAVGFLE